MRTIYIFLALISLTVAEVAVISEPIPGQEYVFVKTSQSEAHPISRKDKNVDASGRPFETAHKFPENLKYKEEKDLDKPAVVKTKVKRQAAAPPGSIKIDAQKLIEKYKSEIQASKASTTKAPASRATTTKSPETSKPKRGRSRSRQKKEAPVATTPNSILTTGAPSTPRTLKIRDTNSAKDEKPADNKRSRIQIKKGPNGQEYEYEYVYYYYDDDEEDNKSKVTNSHDGPARNTIGRGRQSSTTAHPEPAANEVVPSTRGTRGRGRQLNHEVPEEKVPEEKLPLNTRFPPRGRNINTTPSSSEEEEAKTQRTRGRRPAQAQDSTADESQVSGRGRNRANVRRPSLELVDSASFNTHSSNDPAIEPYKEPKARGEKLKDGPSFPQELPDGPVRFLGATPNEKMDLQELKSRLADNEETSTDSDGVVTTEETGTTEVNGMNKVALDLYAILQGTQKLSGESEDGVTESDLTTTEFSTDETTTEVLTTEEITTPTTTTTTTTTTPAPTTTSTTPEPAGRGKFRRPGGSRFKSSPSSTTTAPEPSTEKPKGRFQRPGFGNRPRASARVTTEATEQEITKEESKPVNARPAPGNRNRFSGRGRTTPSATSSPETSESTTAAARPGLTRPRPGSFNLRRRGGTTSTTKEPAEEEEAEPSHEEASTTAKPAIRGRVNGNLARPLRPGPRINLAARGRPGAASTTTAAPEAGEETASEEAPAEEEKTGETTPVPPGKGALNLRNRPRLTVTPAVRPKQAASSPVQVRRTNPLLRKKPLVNAEPSEAPTEAPSEGATEAVAEEEAPSEAPSSTTEEPRGLNKLLAGRRRLVRPSH